MTPICQCIFIINFVFEMYRLRYSGIYIVRFYGEVVCDNIIYQDIDISMTWCVIALSKNKEMAGKAWRLSIILFIIFIVRFHELQIIILNCQKKAIRTFSYDSYCQWYQRHSYLQSIIVIHVKCSFGFIRLK